jgi:CubicO group peptidase (beta-lactamase class C family)
MILPRARQLIEEARSARAFPAAAIEVGRGRTAIWTETFGALTYDAGALPCEIDTIFDLASLTKVIATTSLVMRHVRRGTLSLDTPVSLILPRWRRDDRAAVRVRQLLDHSSGLPAHGRFWESIAGRDDYARTIADLPLERSPGTASVYSDLGFMALGFLLESIARDPLETAFALMSRDWGTSFRFNPPESWRRRIAPTEDDPWRGRVLAGEVHDENAAALGGVAGHAGLFGTIQDVGRFARLVLETFRRRTRLGTPAMMRTFAAPTRVPGSSRALGWDTMRRTSSCGARFSAAAIGHTGFTGTSLWIDPALDLYVVMLTNRVHPTRAVNIWAEWRPRVHDAIVEDVRLEGT